MSPAHSRVNLFLFIFTWMTTATHAQRMDTLLYSDDFDSGTGQWVIEQVNGGEVSVTDGLLDIKDNGGTTVWFGEPLNDSVAIEYQARILSTGASLRDMNCFWMARDPRSTPPMAADSAFFEVQRGGTFSRYHDLRTYYAGFGANSNTTFRFRRYYPADSVPVEMQDLPRNEGRVILQDHDSDGMFRSGDVFLVSERWYKIQLVYFKGKVEYFLDGEKAFEYQEQSFDVPYNSGFFGLRTTAEAHMQVDSLRIYRLTDSPISIRRLKDKPLVRRPHLYNTYNAAGKLIRAGKPSAELLEPVNLKPGIYFQRGDAHPSSNR